MSINYKWLIAMVLMVLLACESKVNPKIVVFPEYCQGCVIRNFEYLNSSGEKDLFEVYFDTTDQFVLETAKVNYINFEHISNSTIPNNFGDYANVVVIDSKGLTTELRTDQTIEKGVHY